MRVKLTSYYYPLERAVRTFLKKPDIRTAYEEKFKTQNMYQVVKSLTYFADADEFTDPIVFDKNLTWAKIKTSISKTVDAYLT